MEILLQLRLREQEQESACHHQNIENEAQNAREHAHLRVGQHDTVVSFGQQGQDDGKASADERRKDRPRKRAEDGNDAKHQRRRRKGASRMSGGRRVIGRHAGISVLPGRDRPVIVIVHFFFYLHAEAFLTAASSAASPNAGSLRDVPALIKAAAGAGCGKLLEPIVARGKAHDK